MPTSNPPVMVNAFWSQSNAHFGVVVVSATMVPPVIVSVQFESIALLSLENSYIVPPEIFTTPLELLALIQSSVVVIFTVPPVINTSCLPSNPSGLIDVVSVVLTPSASVNVYVLEESSFGVAVVVTVTVPPLIIR